MIEYFSTISISEIDFLETLNPLYAFPIIAVIVCMLIVYTFGFKSPVQPPSFERIEEDSKVAKKRKAKEISKKEQGKISQNGKVNGSKQKSPAKKKEEKQTEKAPAEKKGVQVEKKNKPSKKKAHSENKGILEKQKIIPIEEVSEDGWVQLVSKKARKNKKDEAILAESVIIHESAMKQSTDAKNDFQEKAFEKLSAKKNTWSENSDVKKKLNIPLEVNVLQDIAVSQETILNSHVIPEAEKIENVKIANLETSLTKLKADEKSSSKSKKKKKNSEEKVISNPELQNKVGVEPENKVDKPLSVEVSTESPVENKAPLVSNADLIEENLTKEPKTSNVAFDEMAGLYPEAKEPKKKKKVRREH